MWAPGGSRMSHTLLQVIFLKKTHSFPPAFRMICMTPEESQLGIAKLSELLHCRLGLLIGSPMCARQVLSELKSQVSLE